MGAVLAKAGDGAWFKQALNLKSWSGEGEDLKICWLCEASKRGDCNCYDFSRTAKWRKTRVDNQSYWAAAHESGGFLSPIFAIPGFSIKYCRPDFMHTCCLGIVQYCNGSCLWEMFKELGGSRKQSVSACNRIEHMMTLAAKSLSVEPPFDSLTVGMIRKEKAGKKPKLALKAAEGRYFVPVLYHMLAIFLRSTVLTSRRG